MAQPVPSAGQQAAKESQAPAPQPPPPAGATPSRYWELPALSVPGVAKPELREEDRIGTYAQPRWTAARRFPTTRIYVIPEGKAEFEWWLSYTFPTEAAKAAGPSLTFRLPLRFFLAR